jgi:hypothetical protein
MFLKGLKLLTLSFFLAFLDVIGTEYELSLPARNHETSNEISSP